ncbi:hypothetical protein [Nannocystis pusilla]|uniref:hypothetical protein n=1 Tax=Nannocystis pusilla TaxID=889268 RepID=UPI003DA491E7
MTLWEDLHRARGGNGFELIERSIRWANHEEYKTHLVTGLIGSGKSTELNRLMGALQTKRDEKLFHVTYLDANEYLDSTEIGLPDLLTAFLPALVADPILNMPKSAAAQDMWRNVRQWVRAVGQDVAEDIVSGTKGLRVLLKSLPGFQRRFRDRTETHITGLFDHLRSVINEIRKSLLAEGVDDLVIVIDNLEKIHFRIIEADVSSNTHEVFFLNQLPPIQQLPVHMVLSFPLSVYLSVARIRNLYPNSEIAMIPMVRVRDRHTKQDDEIGLAALRALVARRVDVARVFASEEVLRSILCASGGCPRDILRVISQAALRKGELPLDQQTIDAVLREQNASFERVLQGRPYLQQLHHIERTGSFPSGFSNEDRIRLLEELIVVEYNGETWYDVHPFVRDTRAYQGARGDGATDRISGSE